MELGYKVINCQINYRYTTVLKAIPEYNMKDAS